MGDFAHAPDVVAYPESEADVAALCDWCGDVGAAMIPYGGGSSVVGGVTSDVGDGFGGTVTVDMSRMNRVWEIDDVSRAARIQGGARGPELEAQLKPSGLTLRHFPQSFEHSTLGGWVATRSGGHFATLYTHIDDLVESVGMITPAGRMVSRRLPGSGAGPSPDRFMIGLGRLARRHHRGLGSVAGAPDVSRRPLAIVSPTSSPPRARYARSRRLGCSRPMSASSTGSS